jgi:hypothetical protein
VLLYQPAHNVPTTFAVDVLFNLDSSSAFSALVPSDVNNDLLTSATETILKLRSFLEIQYANVISFSP